MEFLMLIVLTFVKAIVIQTVAFIFNKFTGKKAEEKTTPQHSTQSKGGSSNVKN